MCEPPEAEYANLHSETIDDDLLTSFREVLKTANEAALSELSTYSSCMKGNGIEVDLPQDLPDEIRVNLTSGSSDPGGVSFQRAAIQSERVCLEKAHQVALQVIKAPLSSFKVDHAAELDEARHSWSSLQSEAEGMSASLQALDPDALQR